MRYISIFDWTPTADVCFNSTKYTHNWTRNLNRSSSSHSVPLPKPIVDARPIHSSLVARRTSSRAKRRANVSASMCVTSQKLHSHDATRHDKLRVVVVAAVHRAPAHLALHGSLRSSMWNPVFRPHNAVRETQPPGRTKLCAMHFSTEPTKLTRPVCISMCVGGDRSGADAEVFTCVGTQESVSCNSRPCVLNRATSNNLANKRWIYACRDVHARVLILRMKCSPPSRRQNCFGLMDIITVSTRIASLVIDHPHTYRNPSLWTPATQLLRVITRRSLHRLVDDVLPSHMHSFN